MHARSQEFTLTGPAEVEGLDGLGQWVEAGTAAVDAYKGTKGGKKTHEQRVAERRERFTQQLAPYGLTWEDGQVIKAAAAAEGIPQPEAWKKYIAKHGGAAAVKAELGLVGLPAAGTGAGAGGGLMTAGFADGGGIPWIPLGILAGLLVGPKLVKGFRRR